jgi:hypothetical protein
MDGGEADCSEENPTDNLITDMKRRYGVAGYIDALYLPDV